MDIETLSREFQAREHVYNHLKGEALFILERAIERTDIKLHSISSRVKKLDSFLDKAQRKEYENPLDDIQDVVGLRIVCLFISDIERIGKVIRESFSILSEDNKVEGTEVSSFGYMSVHFTSMMKDEYVGPRYNSITKMAFEIQVRTIAMDAWANVSHHLDYKSDKDVPSDLKRDFYALSGLFYVADKHFEMFYGASKQSQEEMSELFEEATPQAKAEQEINLDSLTAYLQTKFPDRKHMGAKAVSVLTNELLRAGYKTIGEIDQIIDSASDAFNLYERELPPAVTSKRFTDVRVVRISVQLADENYHRIS